MSDFDPDGRSFMQKRPKNNAKTFRKKILQSLTTKKTVAEYGF